MISSTEIIIRLLLGALIGGIIGFERQAHGRAAGFRTQLLVCVACVLLMIVSEYYHNLSYFDSSYVRADPARIAAGAITGVGFLGAGVILKTGINVQGLTTAACIWIVSAIGLAIGSGLYLASIITFVITYIALLILRNVEKNMPKLLFRSVTIGAEESASEEEIIAVLQKYNSSVVNTDYEVSSDIKEMKFYITISFNQGLPIKKLLDELSSLRFVKRISIKS